jgi:hypothetical protein
MSNANSTIVMNEIMRRVRADSRNSQGDYEVNLIRAAWDAHVEHILDSISVSDRNMLLDLQAEMVRDADPYRSHWPMGDNTIHLPLRPKTPPGCNWDYFFNPTMWGRIHNKPGHPWHETDPVYGDAVVCQPNAVVDLRTPLSSPPAQAVSAAPAGMIDTQAELAAAIAMINSQADLAATTAVIDPHADWTMVDALADAAANASFIGPMDVLFSVASLELSTSSSLTSVSECTSSLPSLSPEY